MISTHFGGQFRSTTEPVVLLRNPGVGKCEYFMTIQWQTGLSVRMLAKSF